MKTSHLISVEDLQVRLAADASSVLICDCRYDLVDASLGFKAYQTGHIPGAIYVNLGKVLSSAPNGSNGRS